MSGMERRRFINPAQPQTLVIAVYLLYFHAGFLLFALLVNGQFPLLYLAFVIVVTLGTLVIFTFEPCPVGADPELLASICTA